MACGGLRLAAGMADLPARKARLKARQGVAYELEEDVLYLTRKQASLYPWMAKHKARLPFAVIS